MLDSHLCDEVKNAIDGLKDELVQAVSDLVRIPSVAPMPTGFGPAPVESEVSGETLVNNYLRSAMVEAGLETDLWEIEKGRANLVGVRRGRAKGRSILFNGHVDVVPPGPEDKWTIAGPWSGLVRDGRVHGRGSTDMKGGIAAVVFAMKALRLLKLEPLGDVLIQSVIGEEHQETYAGTGAALERGYRADAAIVAEASGPPHRLSINIASPGLVVMQIRVRGKATHISMRPELIRAGGSGAAAGVSAIDKGFLVYQALCRLEDEWGQSKCHPAFLRPGQFTLFPTVCNAGDMLAASVPDDFSMMYIIWHSPKDTPESVAEEVQTHISRFAQTDPWLRANPPEVAVPLFSWPPFETQPEEPICKAAAVASEAALGKPAILGGAAYTSDASFIRQAGIPTVVIGPGSIELAHGFDEYVEVQDLVDAAKIYALTVVEWCGV